jgi:hypothetical protein
VSSFYANPYWYERRLEGFRVVARRKEAGVLTP